MLKSRKASNSLGSFVILREENRSDIQEDL